MNSTRRRLLLDKIAEAASAGIDYIQLREKDLCARDLESLAREAIQIIRRQCKAKNCSPDQLAYRRRPGHRSPRRAPPANDLSPNEIRQIWKCGAGALAREISPSPPQISISCHSAEEVTEAATEAATLAIFAPVFEKKDAPGNAPAGLEALRKACQAKIPVLALGGITLQNAASCLQAGAAGIAAIRLFQENNIAQIVRSLRRS